MTSSTDPQDLQGRVAFVSGGSRGIGAAVAEELSGAGFPVVIGYASSESRAAAIRDGIGAAGGRALAPRSFIARSEAAFRSFIARADRSCRMRRAPEETGHQRDREPKTIHL